MLNFLALPFFSLLTFLLWSNASEIRIPLGLHHPFAGIRGNVLGLVEVFPWSRPVLYPRLTLQVSSDLDNQDEISPNLLIGNDALRLRIAIDWMNYIFEIDDWLEELDVAGNRKVEEFCMVAMRDPINYKATEPGAIMTKSWCARLEECSSVACKERMMDVM
ncbi:hypothetical protein JOM56_010109 [Amanita muscaria]